ncbi:anaerobic ribonucleoside-triphosphate reductase activating protein [Sphingobacterium endophyticum]|uniref:anaerobic ribonucleoside-triphosphate reductase activating protein n=1 Tax=Sphingobacterium endophyticum TaxID=2546448 RepID=UPI0012E0F3B3|nr:anaerobic ribonucleoside-triphosphate reductase activating protein [Sphingobacterium endophyticum]
MANPLYDISPFTLLDYPNKAACIFWFVGCNMRCLYCYNPEIVLGKGKISMEKAEEFLKSRKGLLQAVVFSGGECTMHPDMKELVRIAKKLGYLIKIDTNGARPKVIKKLIDESLVDYVALDFKGIGQKFNDITVNGSFRAFEETFLLLKNSNIDFEVRTTIHSTLLSKMDINSMICYLESMGYNRNYYLQLALHNVAMLSDLDQTYYSKNELEFNSQSFNIIIRN